MQRSSFLKTKQCRWLKCCDDQLILRVLNIIGTFDENPNLNTLLYDVKFLDGAVKQYAENVIAENVLMQVDSNGYNSCLLDNLALHKGMGNAVSKENACVTTKRGVRRLQQTTIGWKFLCEWKDGSSS